MANHAKRLVVSSLTAKSRCYSTSTAAPEAAAAAVNKVKQGSLYWKLLALGRGTDAGGGVADTLDEWVKQGNPVKRIDIIGCVNQFRKFKKYGHAMQLYDWMEKGKYEINNADRAVRIDLLAKIKGLISAEKYFNSLEGSAKTVKTYGALLNCYCKEKKLDEATELFEKMKELSFTSSLNYNIMMSLYLSIGQPEKVPLLAKEMEEMNVAADKYTCNHLINGYASLKDYDAVEGVLERMTTKKVMPDSITYGTLATVYVNAGLIDKASAAIQKLENIHDCEAFHSLIKLYARMSDLSGVNRAWASLKLTFPKPRNISYLIMLSALRKLDDVDGFEKCFSEWESGCSNYDVRVANVVLESYLSRNMIKEANALHENMVSRGTKPNLKTLDLFTNFYIEKREIGLALTFLEMGAAEVGSKEAIWFPHDETVSKFLELFKGQDEETAEKFRERMKKIERLSMPSKDVSAEKVEDESAS